MKNNSFTFLLVLTLTAGIFMQTAKAQVTVTGSAGGANGTYTTLKLAFDALNLVTASQAGKNIVVTLTANTNETAAAVLNQPLIGSWASLTIYPTIAGLSISGNLATPLIDLNGADNVTIDGRVNQTGAKDLVISNTNTSNTNGTSTIRFYNHTSNNTVKYCTIKGSSTTSTGGILWFSDYSNDNNTIDHNDITSCTDANRPTMPIYSSGSSAVVENTGNTISNNNIFDFVNRSLSTNGINIMSNGNAWTIDGNSFYETTVFASTTSVSCNIIQISGASRATVSNNYIGGSAALCGGANAWRETNAASSYDFYGIGISATAVSTCNVQGNTIANFDCSNSENGTWYGIWASGNVNIGTTAGNTIGATTGTGSIKFNGGGGGSGANFYGLYLSGYTGNAQNNTIASITVSNIWADLATNFKGIYVTGTSSCMVGSNTVGSATEPNSINATSASTSDAQTVYGIYSDASSTLTMTHNIIANMTNGTTSYILLYGRINGIYVGNGSNVISNNVVRDLTIANANNANTGVASVSGIVLEYTTAGKVQTITGNTIYNLKNTYENVSTPFQGSVIGLFYNGSVTPGNLSGNFIHSLSVTGAGSIAARLYGIRIFAGTATYSNNIINLGGITLTDIYGIYETGNTNNNNNLYFNTVYIGGAPASGANSSYALFSAVSTNIRDFRNNNFSNARSNAGATGKHFAIYLAYTDNTGLTIDNNDYFAGGTGGMLGYHTSGAYAAANDIATLAAWKTATGQDANSLAIDPSYSVAGGTAALDYYPSATLTGVAGTGVLADYSNFTRNAPPRMGALEFSTAPAPSGNTVDVYNGVTLQASYANLTDAFFRINDGTHKGSIIVKITGSHVISSSAVLNASGTGSADYTDVTVYPTTAGITISGNGSFTEPLIDLNGADNVVIDGRVDGAGSTKSLTITNPSISASTIRFINDATGNTIKYCILKGSCTDVMAGIVCFGTTTGTTGNDNNLIDHNDITNALDANRPVNALFSFGRGTGMENSENTISNNNIYDFLNRGMASFGINLSSNTSAWSITGNSFYETASFAPAAEVEYRVININNSVNGQNFTVSGNFIGGKASLCGGTAFTKTNAFNNSFYGIYIYTSTVIASNIQGNTIQNINWSNTGGVGWYGIFENSGNVNIGTTAGNTIGAATGNGSITFTSGGASGTFYGIRTNSQVAVQNNVIGSVTVASTSDAYSVSFNGIYCMGSAAVNITNNVVGSTVTPNSIYSSPVANASAQTVYGINSSASSLTTISGNTIANLTNGTTNTNTVTTGLIIGIYMTDGSNIVTNNVVHDLTIANANISSTHLGSVSGIVMNNITVGNVQTITGNTIYGLSNTFGATFQGVVTGIYYNGPTTASAVSGNFIYGLSATAGNLYGIKINAGATTYANNIITLGGNTSTTIYGIYERGFFAGNNNNLYFNTVYIGGAPASGTNKSYALFSEVATNTRDFRNNIFSNTRSNAGATGKHFAIYLAYTVNTGLTIDNNDYVASGTGGMLGYHTLGAYAAVNDIATLAAWKTATTYDANSLAIGPSFATPGGTTAPDYYPSATLPGVAGTGTLVDFNESLRDAATPKMGALESASATNAVDLYVGGSFQSSFTNIKTAFDKINDGTYTGSIELKITGSQELTSSAILYGNGMGSANYTSVTVYPTVTGLTISGNLPASLIDLNGAGHVTIDGRVNGAGVAKDLTITNRSISSLNGTSTIRFVNDASNNIVKYCTIKGSSLSTTSGGIIYFATTSGTTGNDNNLIDHNDITCAADANRPRNAVFSAGSAGGAENSNNTISNNHIFDFLNRGANSYGVYISSGSTVWTISGNSFYETAPFVPTAYTSYYLINISIGSTGQDFTVSNNYLGGRAPDCGGLAWTKTIAFDNPFTAIYVSTGTTTASNIQGNTIQNFDYSNSSYAKWYGMYCYAGNINIGTTVGNMIGAATGNGSITLTNSYDGGGFFGIMIESTGTMDVRNNTIGSITTSNTDATASTYFYGIYGSNPGIATISNNTIGSTDAGTTNSIYATSLSTSSFQFVFGISNFGTRALTVTGNTISKLTNGATNTGGGICGIYNQGHIGSMIANNFISDLLVTGATTASVMGIWARYGIGTYANNIIKLGGTTATDIYGIFEEGDVGTETKLYFNTVYIGGTVASGSRNSYALRSNVNTNTRDFRNNIFDNVRSRTGGSGIQYAMYIATPGGSLTCNYNNYLASGTGGMLGYYGFNKSTPVIVTGQDVNSISTDPAFANPGGPVAANYRPATVMAGTSGTGILTDYAGTTRLATPTMGAYDIIPRTYYVKTTGSDGNDGLSWATAKATITAAMNLAGPLDQVWVASGTYLPTVDIYGNASPADLRTKCFQMTGGVAIYGGFAGTESAVT